MRAELVMTVRPAMRAASSAHSSVVEPVSMNNVSPGESSRATSAAMIRLAVSWRVSRSSKGPSSRRRGSLAPPCTF